MKIETLEEKIKLRANERVQTRITAFKDAIKAAVDALLIESSGYGCDRFGAYAWSDTNSLENRDYDVTRAKAEVLRLALCDTQKTEDGSGRCGEKQLPWPARLWRDEEQRVRNEIMSKMDELQRMLLANAVPKEGDATPGKEPNE